MPEHVSPGSALAGSAFHGLFTRLAVLGRIRVGEGKVVYPDDHRLGNAGDNVKLLLRTPRAEFVYHTGVYGIERRLGQQVIAGRSNEISCILKICIDFKRGYYTQKKNYNCFNDSENNSHMGYT